MSLPIAGGGNKWSLKLFSNPSQSVILWFSCFKKTDKNNHQVCRLQTNLWKISQLLKSPGFTIPALLLIMSFHFLPFCDSSICAVVWRAWALLLSCPVGEDLSLRGSLVGPTPTQVQVCQQRLSHAHNCLGIVGHCRVWHDGLTRHSSRPWDST